MVINHLYQRKITTRGRTSFEKSAIDAILGCAAPRPKAALRQGYSRVGGGGMSERSIESYGKLDVLDNNNSPDWW